jgi:hypothetical protein
VVSGRCLVIKSGFSHTFPGLQAGISLIKNKPGKYLVNDEEMKSARYLSMTRTIEPQGGMHLRSPNSEDVSADLHRASGTSVLAKDRSVVYHVASELRGNTSILGKVSE